MTTGRARKRDQDGHGYYQNYAEYNRTLRAWFVVFGVGGPATLIVNQELSLRLAQAGALRYVVALFLVGAAAQVAIALVNKTASGYCYATELNPHLARRPIHRFWAWVNQQFILDVLMDLTSVVTFAMAIGELFQLFG